MEIITTLLGIVFTVLGWLFSIVWFFLSFLLMPFLIIGIIAAVALRFAWQNPMTRPWVESFFKKLGEKGYTRSKQLLYMVSVEPFRVIFRFIGFSVLYAWVNLFWKPKWTPWTRARQRPTKKEKKA